MDGDVPQDLLDTISQRQVLIPTPWVSEHGISSSDEDGVCAVYDIPIIINGSGGHTAGCRAWRNFKLSQIPDPEIWALQMMILAVEKTDEGGVVCTVDKKIKPKLYDRVVAATYFHSTGKGKDGKKLVDKYVKASHYVDLEFQHDVTRFGEAYMKKKRAEKGGTRARKRGRTSTTTTSRRREDEGESEVRARVAEIMDEPWAAAYLDFRSVCRMVSGELGSSRRPETETHRNYFHTCSDEALGDVYRTNAPSLLDMVVDDSSAGEAMESSPEQIAAEERGEDMDVEGDATAPPYVGPKRVTKVQVTLTPIPRRRDPSNPRDEVNPDDHEDVVGYMVRFIVKDPLWNPGICLQSIFDEVDKRLHNDKHKSSVWLGNYFKHWTSTHPAGNRTNRTNYVNIAIALKPELVGMGMTQSRLITETMVSSQGDPAHLVNILTTQRALDKLEAAGGDPDVLKSSQWIDRRNKLATFPQELRTRKYKSEGVFWTHPIYAGWEEQLFPDVDLDDDFIAGLCAGIDPKELLENARDRMARDTDVNNEIQQLLRNSVKVTRKSMTDSKQVPYQTNNEFVHRAAIMERVNAVVLKYYPAHYSDTLDAVMDRVERMGDRWRVGMGEELTQQVNECELYNKLRNKAQKACMNSFESLWQDHGDISQLPVPATIKTMLAWYRDNKHKLPNMTRDFAWIDEDLDVFGNSMLRQLIMYSRLARIIQPIIPMLAEGLFSCYEWAPKELAFHMILHGRYDVGKTYAAIKTLCGFTTIPNTVDEQTCDTAAADTTQSHTYDTMRARDEVPPWMVNKKEAEKVPERVNKEKEKMTSKRLGLVAFQWVTLPNGRSVRWKEKIYTDHHYSQIATTNAVVEAKDALSSRQFRMTVKQVDIPANEMNFAIDSVLKEDCRMYMRINQYLTACAKKCAMVGGILPHPNMDVFEDISNRVLSHLRTNKAITSDAGNRGMEIMRPLARQLVYKRAFHLAFDMPQSPHYMKPFHPSMIRDIQPYLYCTVSITWFCWTALASQWIDDNNANVLEAAVKAADVRWEDGYSAYSMYERDVADAIPWRTRDNPSFSNAQGALAADSKLVDLQYLTLTGTKEQVLSAIAQYTNPRLVANDVEGVIKELKETYHEPDNGGYKPQPKGTFQMWHRFTELPTKDTRGKKATGHGCPSIYYAKDRRGNILHPAGQPRGEEDVPKLGKNAKRPIVDVSELNTVTKKFYFMPQAANRFRVARIEAALQTATICGSTPPGKILMGTVDNKDPSHLDVAIFTETALDEVLTQWDAEQDYGRDEDGRPVYLGDLADDDPEKPVSRLDGIAFVRRNAVTEDEDIAIRFTRMAPYDPNQGSSEDDDFGDLMGKGKEEEDEMGMFAMEHYSGSLQGATDTRKVIADLDYESAKLQHMLCGRPLDEPIRSPAWIREQYEIACEALRRKRKTRHKQTYAGVDYPSNVKRNRAKMERQWKANKKLEEASRVMAQQSKRLSDFRNLSREECAKLDADYTWRDRQNRGKRRRTKKRRGTRKRPAPQPVAAPAADSAPMQIE